jgi:hypothetical protein
MVKNAHQPAGERHFGYPGHAPGEIFAHPGLYQLELQQLREALIQWEKEVAPRAKGRQ